MIRLLVLGPLTVVCGERPLTLPGPRETALLALLTARWPRMATTQELIEDLWPVQAPAGAMVTLRAYVSTLRRALRDGGLPEVVLTRHGGYALAPSIGDGLDARAFESLLARAQRPPVVTDPVARAETLSAALELWRGPAFAEVAAAPGVSAYATYLEEQRLLALERWAEAELARGRHAELAAALAAACREHPVRERLWGSWMVALYRSGRQAEAIESYRELYRRLDEELGLAPGSQLRSLQLAILRGDAHVPAPGDAPVAPGVPQAADGVPLALRTPSGRFVGRRDEVTRLLAASELTRAGAGQIVAVRGEPGVGKTRLVGEAAAGLHERGFRIAYGRCDSADATPYQPFVEALRPRGLVGSDSGGLDAALEGILGQRADRASAVAAAALEVARRRLFDAICDLALRTAVRCPLALILDDLHWADAGSLQLLRHLARRFGQAPLLLILVFRSVPAENDEDLTDALAALDRDPGLQSVDLAGLSEREVGELVSGEPVCAPGLAGWLHRLTDGNPLFVRQLVAQLEPGAGGGARPDLTELAVPAGVREAIQARLGLLGDEALGVLSLAALLGDEFELAELEAVIDAGGADRILDAVEPAVRARVLDPVSGFPERYRFHHELLRDGLRARVSAPRAARLHERIGEALEALPGAELRLTALAGHFAAAARPGHVQRAAEYALRAGRAALGQLAFEQAAAIAERGLRCLALESPGATVSRCELELLLARARLLARDVSGCKAAAARAGADARALGSAAHLARAAITGAHLNVFGQSSPETRALCEDALAALRDSQDAVRAQVLAGFADYMAVSEGDAPRAATVSAQALEVARRSGDAGALARALFVRCETLEWAPAVPERLQLAAELHDLAIAAGDAVAETDAHHAAALARLELGDLAGFDGEVARLEQLRRQAGYWYTDMFALLWRGMRALLDGRLQDTERCCEALLEHARHDANVVNLYMGQLLFLRREQGRFQEFDDGLQAAVKASPDVPAFRCALALSHAELGRHVQARRQLAELRTGGFAQLPRDSTLTTSLALLTEAAALSGDRASAEALAELLRPYAGRVLVATKGIACLGAADRFIGAVLALGGHLSESERHFAAALELERRMGSPRLLARTRQARRLAHSAASSHQ